MLAAACGGTTPSSPALTDPKAIVTAALNSTEAAKSVHLDADPRRDGVHRAAHRGGAGTPVDLTGTTGTADVDFAKPAVKATFAVPGADRLAGEVIAVDGKTYLKTTITGPLYQESAAARGPFDPSTAGDLIDNLGDLLLKEGVSLARATTSRAARSSATRSAPT